LIYFAKVMLSDCLLFISSNAALKQEKQ